MHLMSSTLLLEDTGVPFDELQAEQIGLFRQAWSDAGHAHDPRVSVSRSVIPIVTDEDRAYFGGRREEGGDQLSTWTAPSPGSAGATPASPTRSPPSSPGTWPYRRPIPCC
jgi:alkanesulfonate monooxygenase SsuD/methylene tetrahydromethanopterin reductase-like flavin-dependent oxidoreductase (luciferase family)